MSTVAAEQLIFTRVEAPFSPDGTAGFQTVWSSDGLDVASIRVIEERIMCFRPKADARRLQFFELPEDRVALSRSLPTGGEREVVGKRRDGLFCAHAFILTQRAFAAFANHPFALLAACPYIPDVGQMIDRFGKATGRAPRLAIAVAGPPPATAAWSGDQAARLFHLARQAVTLRGQGQTVALLGEPHEVETALRMVFDLLRPALRRACSFSTSVDGCPFERGAFWAIGATIAPGDRILIPVDAAARRVPEAPPERSTDLYDIWCERALAASSVPAAIEQAPAADEVCRLLEDKAAHPPVAPFSQGALAGLLCHCPGEVERLLLAACGARALEPLRAQRLSEIAREWLARQTTTLRRKQRRKLQRLARAAGNDALLDALRYCSQPGWKEVWR